MSGKQIKRSSWSSIGNDELLSESVRFFPCLYDKSDKGYKERDVVENAWNKVAEMVEFVEDGRLTKVFEQSRCFLQLSCSSNRFITPTLF